MQKNVLTQFLNCRRLPVARDEEARHLHSVLCQVAPDFYLHLLSDAATHTTHKQAILANVLTDPAAQELVRTRMLDLLYALPLDEAVRVVAVIADQRINRSRARELLLAFLIGHEQLPMLAATRRQRIVRLLKHALGERTWSTIGRFLAESTPEGEAFLQHEVLRYAWQGNTERAREVLCFLTGVPFTPHDPALAQSVAVRKDMAQGAGMPVQTLTGVRGIYHKKVPLRRVYALAAPSTEAVRQDGTLTHLYKETFMAAPPAEPEVELEQTNRQGLIARLYNAFAPLFAQEQPEVVPLKLDITNQLESALDTIPYVQGHLGIVLDLSGSMVSSGERQYHPAALALAVTRLLQARVRTVTVAQVGGDSSSYGDTVPRPTGASDLASGLIALARLQTQAIFIITDGYENARQGDAQQVVQGLRQLDIQTPIYQVVPLFAETENLSQRLLGANIPLIPLAHETNVRELLVYMLLAGADEILSSAELAQLRQLLFVR